MASPSGYESQTPSKRGTGPVPSLRQPRARPFAAGQTLSKRRTLGESPTLIYFGGFDMSMTPNVASAPINVSNNPRKV
jgi:hypothetical protein